MPYEKQKRTIKGPEELVPESREKGKVILDMQIGTFPLGVLGERKVGAKDKYIGTDADRDKLEIAKLHGENAYLDPEANMVFVNSKGEQAPVRDNSVDEVLLRNVLGNPASLDFSKVNADDHEAFAQYERRREEEIARYAEEAARVLKEAGKVVIVETITPDEGARYAKFFTNNDAFRVTKFSYDPEELKPYFKEESVFQNIFERSFILELQKKGKKPKVKPTHYSGEIH